MEGCSSINSKHQVFTKTTKPIRFGVRAMERDVNTVLKGLATSGVKKVIVADWHDTSRNLRKNRLYGGLGVELVSEDICSILKSTKNIDAVILVGFHAKPGVNSVLSHCYSFSVKNLFIDGVKRGETASNMYIADQYNAPVIFISGSHDAVKEAKELNEEILSVVTKKGYRLRSSEVIQKELTKKIIEAVKGHAKVNKVRKHKIVLEFEDDSKYILKGSNFVEKYQHMEDLVEKYLKKKGWHNNSHILINPKIR